MKLPRYVHHFTDRHDHARFYFRRAGHKRVTLPGCRGLQRSWRLTTKR
jgi:hypothetical protein